MHDTVGECLLRLGPGVQYRLGRLFLATFCQGTEPTPIVPQVPALVLQSGVLRCRVPPHPPGIVRICLTNGDGRPRSRLHTFEYRDAPDANTGAPNRWADIAWRA